MFRADDISVENSTSVCVRNQTGAQIAAGKLVAVAGYDATTGLILIQLADNTASTYKAAIGFTTAAIDHNANGDVIRSGLASANTTGRTIGDPVYLGTSGDFVFVAPTSARIQEIGQVAVVGNPGKIFSFFKDTPIGYGEINSARYYGSATQNTTSGSFEDIPGATVNITTTVTGYILAQGNLSVSNSGAGAGSELEVRLVIDGENGDPAIEEPYADYERSMTTTYRTAAKKAPGTYTVKLQWRRVNGALTLYGEDISIDALCLGAVGAVGAQGPVSAYPPIFCSAFGSSSGGSIAHYYESSATSYETAAVFVFPGTSVRTPTTFKAVLARSGSTGTSDVRIQDVTNGNEVALINYSASGEAIYTDSTLTNLPAGEARFEIQVRKSAFVSSNTRLISAVLY